MPDPAELSHGVLLRVAEFLKKLPADQLAELADGTARLEVVPKGGRVVGPGGAGAKRAAAAKPPPVSADQVRAELTQIGDRAAARRWLDDQGLTVPQLKALAKELDISMPAKAKKEEALDKVVHGTIGRRLGFEAVSRSAPART